MKVSSLAFIIVVITSVLFTTGCSREVCPSAENGTFAIIDGVPITAKELREAVLLRARMAELSKRPIPQRQFADWANSYAMRILPGLVQANVLEHALKARGLTTTPESETVVLEKYNRLTKQKAGSIEELAGMFQELKATFISQASRESLFEAYARSCPEVNVDESDLSVYYASQSNLQARCSMITELGWRKGRKAYAELVGGKSWESVAKEFSEDGEVEPTNADNWKEWMTIQVSRIEPKELADAIAKLSIGQYTEPIDIDEGLVIVRLADKDGDVCSLSRILIRLGRIMEMPDRESAVKAIRQQKWHNAQRQVLEQARKDFKVEYLFTTNFSYKIWATGTETANKKTTKGQKK